jgi:hypothetical protein
MTINFSGRHYPSDIIMIALRYYLAYKLSYREIEKILALRPLVWCWNDDRIRDRMIPPIHERLIIIQ